MEKNPKNIFKKKLIGTFGKFTIYLVDDEIVRNKAEYAEEFSDYGVNICKKGLSTLNFKFIPKDEIWIAKSIKQSERHFIIGNALSYVKNIENGINPGDAYDKALEKEQARRTKDIINKLHIKQHKPMEDPPHKDIPGKVYVRKYLTIKDNKDIVKVYLINGEVVRDLYKTDYVEGGHGYVYEWIPLDEIWVDAKVKADEIPVIILHEYLERILMKFKGFPYVRAHNAALKVEFDHRGIFNKKDAASLSRHVVMYKLLKNIKY
jgi:hypothetical protein